MKQILLSFSLLIFFLSCSLIVKDRTHINEMENDDGVFIPRKDFSVVGGDPISSRSMKEVWERTPQSSKMKEMRRYDQFSTNQNLDENDDNVYSNAKNMKDKEISEFEHRPAFSQQDVQQAINQRDIIIGMSKSAVKESWGAPVRIDVAGNPKYQNERWVFFRNGQSKYIFFENGHVMGWESK